MLIVNGRRAQDKLAARSPCKYSITYMRGVHGYCTKTQKTKRNPHVSDIKYNCSAKGEERWIGNGWRSGGYCQLVFSCFW